MLLKARRFYHRYLVSVRVYRDLGRRRTLLVPEVIARIGLLGLIDLNHALLKRSRHRSRNLLAAHLTETESLQSIKTFRKNHNIILGLFWRLKTGIKRLFRYLFCHYFPLCYFDSLNPIEL